MKRQTAFLFIPLLFAFNPINLDNLVSRINLPWQAQNVQAQLVPVYQSTTTGIDTSTPNETSSSSPEENSEDLQSSLATDTTSTASNASASTSDESTTSVDAGATAAETSTSSLDLSDLIPSLLPTMPGVPDTGAVDAATTAPSLASTSEIGSALATTIAPIVDSMNTDSASTAASSSESLEAASSTTGGEVSAASTSTTETDEDSNSSDTTQTIPASSADVFSTGAVTFRFDDGWSSQFDTALPILEGAGIKGTFYIVSHQLSDDGFSGFVSSAQVQQMAANGEEIGSHTRTHPHLPTLASNAQQQEISGAKQDLEALGVHPQTFSYPYGEYTSETMQIVKDAGYVSAVTTAETPVSPNSDPFQLEAPSVTLSQSPAQIEAMIDNAIAKHQWIVLTFHRIDNSGDPYSITPENFQEIVNYIKDHQIPTVTVSQGAAQLQ